MTGPPCVGLIGGGSTHLIEDFLFDHGHPDYLHHNDHLHQSAHRHHKDHRRHNDHQHHQQYDGKVNVGNDRAPLCRPNRGRGGLI